MNDEFKKNESESTDELTERKQVFVGAIRKCPNCGGQILSNTTKCPACGFEIERSHVSGGLDAFIKKFMSIESDAAKRAYIESYAVPNNKGELRDFLTYAASQRDKDYFDKRRQAYWVDVWNNKCRQIINQGIDIFGMNEDFSALLKRYKASVEETSAQNERLKEEVRIIEAKEAKKANKENKKRAKEANKEAKKRAKEEAKKWSKWGSQEWENLALVVILVLIIGLPTFGIVSCRQKHKHKRQEMEQLKVEVSNLLAKGYVVPKENVSLSGLLSTYCEVIGDAQVTFELETYEMEADEFYGLEGVGGKVERIRFDREGKVSVPVRVKKDFASAYREQYDVFVRDTSSIYNIKRSDIKVFVGGDVRCNVINDYASSLERDEIIGALLSADVGQTVMLSYAGDVDKSEPISIKWRKKFDIQSDTIVQLNIIKDKIANAKKELSFSLQNCRFQAIDKDGNLIREANVR